MDSSATLRHHNDHKLVPKKGGIFRYLSSYRTPSFSSSSSLSPSSSSFESLYFADDSLLSPATPHRFSGVPFSWEHLPGIPKNQSSKKKQESSLKHLPLPPPTTTINHSSSKKLNHEEPRIRKKKKKNSIQSTSQRDPFLAAMVKCSKDDHHEEKTSRNLWNDAKVTRSLSDRFGFINLYPSCKRTCAVNESIIYIPSSRRSIYEQFTHRSL